MTGIPTAVDWYSHRRWLVTPPLTIIGTVKHKALVPAWRWGSQALGKSQMKLSWTNREVKVKCREKTREKAGPDPDTAVWLVNRSFTLCSLSCGGAFIRLCYFPSTTVQFSTGYLLGANERSEVKRSIHFPICYVPCVRLAPTVYYRLVRSSNDWVRKRMSESEWMKRMKVIHCSSFSIVRPRECSSFPNFW